LYFDFLSFIITKLDIKEILTIVSSVLWR